MATRLPSSTTPNAHAATGTSLTCRPSSLQVRPKTGPRTSSSSARIRSMSTGSTSSASTLPRSDLMDDLIRQPQSRPERPHAAQARARWGALGVGYRIALGSRPRYRWSAVKAAAQSDPALRNAWIGSGDNRHRTCPCHLPRQVAPQPSVLRWEGRRRAGTVQSHPAPWPPLVARATRGAVAVRCAGNHSTPAGSLPRRHRMARIGSISSIRSVQVTGGSHR